MKRNEPVLVSFDRKGKHEEDTMAIGAFLRIIMRKQKAPLVVVEKSDIMLLLGVSRITRVTERRIIDCLRSIFRTVRMVVCSRQKTVATFFLSDMAVSFRDVEEIVFSKLNNEIAFPTGTMTTEERCLGASRPVLWVQFRAACMPEIHKAVSKKPAGKPRCPTGVLTKRLGGEITQDTAWEIHKDKPISALPVKTSEGVLDLLGYAGITTPVELVAASRKRAFFDLMAATLESAEEWKEIDSIFSCVYGLAPQTGRRKRALLKAWGARRGYATRGMDPIKDFCLIDRRGKIREEISFRLAEKCWATLRHLEVNPQRDWRVVQLRPSRALIPDTRKTALKFQSPVHVFGSIVFAPKADAGKKYERVVAYQ